MTLDDELALKRANIVDLLAARSLDGLLLMTPPAVSWITCGGDPVVDLTAPYGVAGVLCTREGETLLTNTIEHTRLLEEALPRPPERVEVFGWYEDAVPDVARRLYPGARLGADASIAGFVDCVEALRARRLILTSAEIDRYRALCRDAADAVEETAGTIEPGMTELEIAGALAAGSYDRGAAPIVALVAADERVSRYRHPVPTRKRLERYALMVLCARRHGLVANVTRAVHFGALPDDLRRRQEACARVDAAFLAATRPGATAGEVFAAGAAAYAAEGFGEEWKLHHQGGATGYASREWLAAPDSTYAIQPGMAFAWNPSITGVKSEDTTLLGPSGMEALTSTGEWPTIDVSAAGSTFRRPRILER